MQSPSTKPIGEDMQHRIEQFAGQVVTDLAAAMAGVMTNLGHKLGLYRQVPGIIEGLGCELLLTFEVAVDTAFFQSRSLHQVR